MAEELCPVCGCILDPGESCEREGVVYCCESCATGEGDCECGCLIKPEDQAQSVQ